MCTDGKTKNVIGYFLQPTVAAIEAGKDIALANKETMIAGAPFVLPLAQKHNIKILPADSEHSAIFQVLKQNIKLQRYLILSISTFVSFVLV